MVAIREVEQQINQWEQWALLTSSVYPHVAWLFQYICNDTSSEEKKKKLPLSMSWDFAGEYGRWSIDKGKEEKDTEDIS